MEKTLTSSRSKRFKILEIIFFMGFLLGGEILFVYYPSNIIKTYNQYTTTEDGIKICYDVFEPASSSMDLNLKKAVILGHGFTVNKEVMRLAALDLAKAGFVAVAFDFRSHGRSGGNFNFMGQEVIEKINDKSYSDIDHFEGLKILTQDIYAIKKYLTLRGDIDIQHLGYVGYSMGGAPGFAILSTDNDFQAMVGWSPNTDIGSINQTNSPNLLLILAQFDEFTNFNTLAGVMANKTGISKDQIIPDHLYGSFTDGSAAKLYIQNGAEHYLEGYNPFIIQATTEWMQNSLMSASNTERFPTYPILIFSVILQVIGGLGLFFLLADYMIKRFGKSSTSRLIPDSIFTKIQTQTKNNSSKQFWVASLILSFPLMGFILPFYLPPLLLTGFILMFLLGPSLAVFILMDRLLKRENMGRWVIYRAYFQTTNFQNILLGFGLGILFYGIIWISLGKINGFSPSFEKWTWFPIYFGLIIFCFLNRMFYFQAYRFEMKIKFDNTNPLKIVINPSFKFIFKSTFSDFITTFGLTIFLISIPSILLKQYLLLMFLIPYAIILFAAAVIANFSYVRNKDIWIPTLIISVVVCVFFCIMSPMIHLFQLNY